MELLELCSAEMLKKVIYKTSGYQQDRREARSSQDECMRPVKISTTMSCLDYSNENL